MREKSQTRTSDNNKMVNDAMKKIKTKKWRWAGHLARWQDKGYGARDSNRRVPTKDRQEKTKRKKKKGKNEKKKKKTRLRDVITT